MNYGKFFPHTYEEIFEKVDQLEVWRWITGHPSLQVNQFITSPFRGDNKPRCYIRKRGNVLLFTDWRDKKYMSYTCIHAVAELAGLNIYNELSTAASLVGTKFIDGVDIQLSITPVTTYGTKRVETTNGSAVITPQPFLYNGKPTFREIDKEYWYDKRGIGKDILLNENQPVLSVQSYYLNGKQYFPQTYPCFALCFKDSGHVKIYQPNSPKGKRFPVSTTDNKDIWKWFYDFLPTEQCIITKSYKDGAMLYNCLKDSNLKVDIYAFQSEGTIPFEFIDSVNEDHYRKLILFDNDMAGITAAYKLLEYIQHALPVFYPLDWGKDTDDVYLKYGKRPIIEYIGNYLNY